MSNFIEYKRVSKNSFNMTVLTEFECVSPDGILTSLNIFLVSLDRVSRSLEESWLTL